MNTIQTSMTLRRIQDCIHSVRSDRTDNHLVPIQISVPIGLCLFLNLACLGLANQAKLFLYHSFSARLVHTICARWPKENFLTTVHGPV